MRRAALAIAILIGAAALVALARPAVAQQRLEQIFERANRAAFAGDWQSAVEGYRQLVVAGVDDPDVHYNLATAYAQGGQYGRAILHYENVLRLSPGDDAAERGIAGARAILGRRRAEAHGEAVVETRPPFFEALVRPFSEGALAWLVLGLDFVLFALLIALGRVRAESGRLAIGIAAPLTGVLLLLAAGGLAVKTGALRDGDAAIVVASEASLREGPDPRARSRASAFEGETAAVRERHGQWAHVELSGGREGWVSADDVGVVGRL